MNRSRLAPLIFLLAAVAMFPRAVIGLETFFHYDTWMQNLTFRAWWFDQLRAGHFATWCPGMFAGYPLFAETQTGPLYPPTFLLFLALPATLAFSWSVVLHFALAGFGTWLVLRRAGVGVAGALLGGLVFELSGFLVAHVVHFNLLTGASWTPWVALASLGLARGSMRCAPALAGILAMLLLGAHPYATMMNVLLAGAVVLGTAPGRRELARGLPLLAGAGGLGAAVAAVQILPTRAFLPSTTRGEGVDWSFLTFGSFPPWNVATLAAPDVYGSPVTATFWAGPDWSHYAETCAFVGILTLALAVVAVGLRRDRLTVTLVAIAAVSFLLMLGRYTPVYRLLTFVPLLESTRLPARFALPWTFAVAALAGLGLDALRRAEPRARTRAMIAAGLIVVGLSAFAAAEGDLARRPPEELLQTGRAWAAFVPGVVEQAGDAFTRLAVELAASLVVLAMFLIPAARKWAPPAAVVVAGLSLFTWGRAFNPTMDVEALRAPPPVVAELPDRSPRPRVFRQGVAEQWSRRPGQPRADLMTPGWRDRTDEYRTGAWTLPPNSQLLYGVDSGEGFTSLLPRSWLDWMGLSAQPGATPRPDLSEAQADLLSIDAVITTGSGIAGEGWEARALPGDVWVSRNVDPLPRVRLATRWEVLDRAEILRRIADPRHDPRAAVLLESEPPGPATSRRDGSVDGPVPAREVGPGHWEIDLPVTAEGLVVVAESFDPDWIAEGPDGRVPVQPAEGLLLSFPVPEGGGVVRLRHAPSSARVGAMISVFASLVLLALALRFGRRATATDVEPSPAPAALGPGIALAAVAVMVGSVAAGVGGVRSDRAEATLAAAAARSWSDEARAAHAAGAHGPARDLLRRAERLRPDDPALPYRRGLVDRSAGDEAAAAAAFRRALEIDGEFAPARDALTDR